MSDLTAEEQNNVRTAIRFLRLRVGTWAPLAKVLHVQEDTIWRVVTGRRPVSASVAMRVARFMGASHDSLLAGTHLPVGTCRFCGHPPAEEEESAGARTGGVAAKG